MTVRQFLAMLTAASVSACGADQSAGAPANGAAGVTWIIDATPALVIGSEGTPDYEFSGIVGLGRIGTRGWVVADGSSRQLRFYDRDGRFVSRSGGRGEGPGEFQDITRASVVDEETIYTHDQRLQRVSVWSSDGDFVHSFTLRTPLEGGIAPLMIGLADPRTLVWSSYDIPPCVVNEVVADSMSLYALDVSDTRPDTDSTSRSCIVARAPSDGAPPSTSCKGVSQRRCLSRRALSCSPVQGICTSCLQLPAN